MRTNTILSENLPIKSWAVEDRPREKLLTKGRQYLSNAELLAIILGSGSKEESVLSLAKRMLRATNNNLNVLSQLSIAELMRFKGIGKAKAISVAAVMELATRKLNAQAIIRPQILDSEDAFQIMQPLLSELKHEEFWVLLLNTKNRLLASKRISVGGMDKTIVDNRILFKTVIEGGASAVILCHNHPSGEPEPSRADINLTNQIVEGGRLLGVRVLDHIVIGGNTYCSLEAEGLMKKNINNGNR